MGNGKAQLSRRQPPGSTTTLLRGGEGTGQVCRTVLPGGLRVITEEFHAVRSAAVGIWAGVGSRDETAELHGASHFLEHLLLKGTRRRSAFEIAAAIEAAGGEANAFTGKEFTWYYARVRDQDLPLAVSILSDVLTEALLADSQVEAERQVILHEIAMYDDDPAKVAQEAFEAALFGASPLGRTAVGTRESVAALSRPDIAGFYAGHYQPTQLVVAAAGNLRHADVVALVSDGFAGRLGDQAALPAPPRPGQTPTGTGTGTGTDAGAGQAPAARVTVIPKETVQANVVLGVPGVSHRDPRRYANALLASALGGGLSSRLFQEVRERRGLAYAVGSYARTYADTGLFAIQAACVPDRVDELVAACRDQLAEVAARGLSPAELDRAKGSVTGNLVLAREDTMSRMARLATSELLEGELQSVDYLLSQLERVSVDEIGSAAASILAGPPVLAVAGPFPAGRDFSAALGLSPAAAGQPNVKS